MRPYLVMHQGYYYGDHQPSVWSVGAYRNEKIGEWPVASGANAPGYGGANNVATPMRFNNVIRFQNSLLTIQSGNVWRYGDDTNNQWVPIYTLKSHNINGIQGHNTLRSRVHTGLYYYVKDNHPCLTFAYYTSNTATTDLIRGVTYDGYTGEWRESEIVDSNDVGVYTAGFLEEFINDKIYFSQAYGAGQTEGSIWDPVSSGIQRIYEWENWGTNNSPSQMSSSCVFKNTIFQLGYNGSSAPNHYTLMGVHSNVVTSLLNPYLNEFPDSVDAKPLLFTLDNNLCWYIFPLGTTTPEWEGSSFSLSDNLTPTTGVYVFPHGNPYIPLPFEFREGATATSTSRMNMTVDRHDLDNLSDVMAYIQGATVASEAETLTGLTAWYKWTHTLATGYFLRAGTSAGFQNTAWVDIAKNPDGGGERHFNGNLAYIQVEGYSEGSTERTCKIHYRIYESAEFPSGTPCEALFLFGPGNNIPRNFCTIQSSEQGSVRDQRYITGLTFGSGNLYTCEWDGITDGLDEWDGVKIIPVVSGVF